MFDEKLTYLVTNYNNARYLRECITSIINQNNSSWRCIIVDDCSTDDSMEVIDSAVQDNEYFKVIRNPKNIGQIATLIQLLEITETDIVGVVDSDDAIHPSTTDYILDAYAKSPSIGMVYTNCIEYEENLRTPISIGQAERLPFGPASSIIFGYVSSLRTYRISCYKKTQGYDLDLLYAEDMDLAYKLEEVCLPFFVNKCLYKYRSVPTSRSREISTKDELLKNHLQAKYNAVNRRSMNFLDRMLCKFTAYAEYKAKLNKRRNKAISKNIYYSLHRLMKYIISNKMYKVISVK